MKSLKEILHNPESCHEVVRDGMRTLEEEVSRKSGLFGMAIKGAYKVLKGVRQGKVLQKAVEVLMPDFIDKLDPYFVRYQKEGKGSTWTEFLRPHYDTIADQLLTVTDTKVRQTEHRAIRTPYEKLRPKARKEVVASLPALARMMERHIPKI